ncbi:hypothetical protein QM306_35760, partial [Burkholderia cenocepacia]|nr:hypothetical protein [Burkholderia cenocepacia]
AIADGDPNLYLLEKRSNGAYTELATNLSGEYARKVCCVIGARGDLVRNDRPSAAALARSIVQAGRAEAVALAAAPAGADAVCAAEACSIVDIALPQYVRIDLLREALRVRALL